MRHTGKHFTPKTRDQIKAEFAERGVTITQWAAQNGYSRGCVYQVLNGFTRASWGQCHEIAVALGMKPAPESAQPKKLAS
jgi:gp16 family phage-associated protein